VAGTQPAIAIQIASTLAPGIERDNLLDHAISQWASIDAQAAGAWAEQIADASLRQRLLATVACSLADRDGAAAGALVANKLSAGVEQDRAVIEIIERWAQTSPGAAGSWITSFPDTPLRQTAAQALVGVWSVLDNAEAASWVRNLPQGSLREAGLAALADANMALPK